MIWIFRLFCVAVGIWLVRSWYRERRLLLELAYMAMIVFFLVVWGGGAAVAFFVAEWAIRWLARRDPDENKAVLRLWFRQGSGSITWEREQ